MFATLAEPIDAITPTTPGPSPARKEASKVNGSLSKGPVSLEGKARSRRNGCKEGLTGAGIVLPPDAAAEVARREAGFADVFRPRDMVEQELIRQMALGSWRGEVLGRRIIQHDARMNAARFANWEQEQQLAAADLGRRISEDPEDVVIRLQFCQAGCDWLIDRWTLLGNGLSTADEGGPRCTWTDADLALALDLRGIPVGLRHLDGWSSRLESLCAQARSGSDEGVTGLREIVTEQLAALERRRKQAWEGVEQPQLQDWLAGVDIDLGPDGTRLRRYEMAADRLFRSAWNKLERRRKECGEPLFPNSGRRFAAEPAARPDPFAAPCSQPVPPAPPPPPPPDPVPVLVPARPEPAVPFPARLDDLSPALDLWIGGPPLSGIGLGNLFQNKTNPTPIRPANGGQAARRRNRP